MCVPSLTPSLHTVAALPYNFTDEVVLTDEVSTIRFVAPRLFPFKVYPAPIVCTPGDLTSHQESKPASLSGNLAVILQKRIRLLLLLVSKITHIYFSVFIRARYVYVFVLSWYLGDWLAFLAIMLFVRCFCPYDVCSVQIYLDVGSDLVRGNACSILLLTMRSEIFGSLSSSIAVADGSVLVVCHFSFVVDRPGRRT